VILARPRKGYHLAIAHRLVPFPPQRQNHLAGKKGDGGMIWIWGHDTYPRLLFSSEILADETR
jgi:hypothetical protein